MVDIEYEHLEAERNEQDHEQIARKFQAFRKGIMVLRYVIVHVHELSL